MSPALPEGRRGRLLALGVAALLLAALWAAIAAPLLDLYGERETRIERQEAALARMRGLAAALPALRRAVAEGGDAPAGGGALEGTTDALAAAALQQVIDGIARDAGVRIASIETLPTEPAGDHQVIGLRLTLSVPWDGLVRLLAAIATHDTVMVADNVQLRALSRAARDEDNTIDTVVTVTAWRPRDGAPGGG